MNKKKLEKILMVVGPVVLFSLVLLVVLTFHKDSEEVVIDNPPNVDKNPIVFENNSSMEESEIRELVERERLELQVFFKDLKYYNISEVADGYTKEDDSNYLVIGESYLETLKMLLTMDAYSVYWDELTEVNIKPTIDVQERLYMARIDLFLDIFTHSAIAMEGVNVESLILVSASDEKIEAIENIKYCEENLYDVCQRDERYSFVLEYESNAWKISEFTKAVN